MRSIFNNFFAKQCTIVNNTSKLSIDYLKKTSSCLPTIYFTKDYIVKIIKNLNPDKAHGQDMISIRMLKIFCESVLKPLALILKLYTESRKFPIEWKKTNVVPVHKK